MALEVNLAETVPPLEALYLESVPPYGRLPAASCQPQRALFVCMTHRCGILPVRPAI